MHTSRLWSSWTSTATTNGYVLSAVCVHSGSADDVRCPTLWQEAELFMVAKARSSQMVEVQCDGCESLVRSGTFYHNMELLSSSFDLCPSCFKSESLSPPLCVQQVTTPLPPPPPPPPPPHTHTQTAVAPDLMTTLQSSSTMLWGQRLSSLHFSFLFLLLIFLSLSLSLSLLIHVSSAAASSAMVASCAL